MWNEVLFMVVKSIITEMNESYDKGYSPSVLLYHNLSARVDKGIQFKAC